MEFVGIDGARSIRGGVAVVIDVMRAYTVAAWALHLGAKEIALMDDVEESVALVATIPGSLLLKDGAPDPRFDLHNSPHQLLDLDLAGRTIVQCTTAGTRAAVAAQGADHILCAGLVCASATAAVVGRLAPDDVTFVVSGGLDADEDLACAELIAQTITGEAPDPAIFVKRALASEATLDLQRGIERGYAGVSPEDLPMCVDVDRFDFPMQAHQRVGHLVLRAS